MSDFFQDPKSKKRADKDKCSNRNSSIMRITIILALVSFSYLRHSDDSASNKNEDSRKYVKVSSETIKLEKGEREIDIKNNCSVRNITGIAAYDSLQAGKTGRLICLDSGYEGVITYNCDEEGNIEITNKCFCSEGFEMTQQGYCEEIQYDDSNICLGADEGQTLTLIAPKGKVWERVIFASYGTSNGCDEISKCHSKKSAEFVANECLGKTSCEIKANKVAFGDPCPGVGKWFNVKLVSDAK